MSVLLSMQEIIRRKFDQKKIVAELHHGRARTFRRRQDGGDGETQIITPHGQAWTALSKPLHNIHSGFSDVIVTEESKKLGFQYLSSKDELTAWFDSYYERDDREMVSVKDIFNQLKRTSFYTEMDKKEKRLFTYNSLIANLQKSLALNKYLMRPDEYNHGKRVKGYTIRGWKPKPDMMDDGW